MQVNDVLTPLAKAMGLFTKTAFGGAPYHTQIFALERGVDVLVATPGRLADLIERGACSLDSVEVSVLDEADQMADMGFLPDVTALLVQTPAKAQRLLFSATLDGDVDTLVKRFMHDPVTHEVDGAVAASLRAVAARARLGADVAAGLRSVARSSSLAAHWERLAVCWQLAQDHGLAIATLMQTAQRDIVERGRFTAKVDAGMTGARTTAAVLAGLPLLGVGLGQLIGADPVSFLLSGGMGGWLLVIGVALACGGLLWSDHITAQVST